jgi:hypothetical protein
MRAGRAALWALAWGAAACSTTRTETVNKTILPEAEPRVIALAGPCADPKAEISGMAWWGDTLVLLPQYPDRFLTAEAPQGVVFSLTKQEVEAYLAAPAPAPLTPKAIPIKTSGLGTAIEGFEGFEALLFRGDDAFLTVEASPGAMEGWVVRGRMDGGALVLEAEPRLKLAPQRDRPNASYEALTSDAQGLVAFYELNSGGAAQAWRVEGLRQGPALAMPPLECRLTDATPADAQGRFWATNYCWAGDKDLIPARDALRDRFGVGRTHKALTTTERLVELQLGQAGISFTQTPPIYLKLTDDDHGRNWEGLAPLGEGFLLVTDKHPGTVLAYVARPPAPPLIE